MRIMHLEPQPIDTIPYDLVAPRCWFPQEPRKVVPANFPILHGSVDVLPASLDALVIASDLQGHIDGSVMGLAVPSYVQACLQVMFPETSPERVGVLLGGDLFSLPDKRGGLGDVRNVWRAFRQQFCWVAGVLGNHDLIGKNIQEHRAFGFEEGVHVLDGQQVDVDGLSIGGVSGVAGSPEKPNRKPVKAYLHLLERVLRRCPQLTILHETPDYPAELFPGKPWLREGLELGARTLVVCGHRHWSEPLRTLSNGTQVLNCEGRVVILHRHAETSHEAPSFRRN